MPQYPWVFTGEEVTHTIDKRAFSACSCGQRTQAFLLDVIKADFKNDIFVKVFCKKNTLGRKHKDTNIVI